MRSRKNNQSSILLAANSIIDNQSNGGSGRPSGIGGNKLAQKAANIIPIFEGGGAGVPQFHHEAVNDAYSQGDANTPMH
jgi:hypothetical protein